MYLFDDEPFLYQHQSKEISIKDKKLKRTKKKSNKQFKKEHKKKYSTSIIIRKRQNKEKILCLHQIGNYLGFMVAQTVKNIVSDNVQQ